jgi:hypothetical protein
MDSKEAPSITARLIRGQHARFGNFKSRSSSNLVEIARVLALPGNNT